MQICKTNACKFKRTHMQPNSEPGTQDETKVGRVMFKNPNTPTRCIHARTLSLCNFNARALQMSHINIFSAMTNIFLLQVSDPDKDCFIEPGKCVGFFFVCVFVINHSKKNQNKTVRTQVPIVFFGFSSLCLLFQLL